MKEINRRRSLLLLHASKLKISILLLQLLCLPPCCVPVDAPRTAAAEREEMEILRHRSSREETLEGHHNLRAAARKHYSFMGAFYSLLGIAGESSVDMFDGQRDGGVEASTAGRELVGDDRRLQSKTANKEWYVDWVSAQCVQSCDPGTTTNPNCAGLALRENFLFASAKDCCGTMLPWKTADSCTRVGNPDGINILSYQDFTPPPNNWQDLSLPGTGGNNWGSTTPGGGTPAVGNYQPPPTNYQPPANTITVNEPPSNKPGNYYKPPPTKPSTGKEPPSNKPGNYYKPPPTKPKPVAPAKDNNIVPKTSTCWRSGMSCSSEAQKFACCGKCQNEVCV